MSKRSRAGELAAAIESNFAGSRAARHNRATVANGRETMTRSTFSAPPNVIVELRTMALRCGCTMNDLLLVGIEDLLRAAGCPCQSLGDADLRDKIKQSADQPNSAAAHSEPGACGERRD